MLKVFGRNVYHNETVFRLGLLYQAIHAYIARPWQCSIYSVQTLKEAVQLFFFEVLGATKSQIQIEA